MKNFTEENYHTFSQKEDNSIVAKETAMYS